VAAVDAKKLLDAIADEVREHATEAL